MINYKRKKQSEMKEDFDKGSLEIMVCVDCDQFFRQPKAPRSRCHGCFCKQTKEEKREHQEVSESYRRMRCTLQGKRLFQEIRLKKLRELQGTIKEIPVILPPKLEAPKRYDRPCLRCSKTVHTNLRHKRLCEECTHYAGKSGMPEHTHYYVTE